MALGLYISVPFCRTKCSFCNFASGVFSEAAFENYVARLTEDIASSRRLAGQFDCKLEATFDSIGDPIVDSIYLGGGTPSILGPGQLGRIFAAARQHFAITPDAEITVECAPGTLSATLIDSLLQCGVNRVSLGVQSFVDREAHSVGRLHNREIVLDEIRRLREDGLDNISIDLIAGLPHQTAESWDFSVAETIATGVPHASVYMLEVDEDSRLGSELIAGGARYHAHFVPDDDATADFYQQACVMLKEAGIVQYEISNFARGEGIGSKQSRHNLKYWTRQPYIGFGVDAHSMLPSIKEKNQAVRFATPDSLDAYMNRRPYTITEVSRRAAMEEAFFLGLRLNRGIDLDGLSGEFGTEFAAESTQLEAIRQCVDDGLVEQRGATLRLTARGRLLSNEVFGRFLIGETMA
ncbi:MAG TPA: radical SAM family heme chaperone HemW [Terriglobales bacterium]|nr:radical SAM family heme chaperone HemW [Terriglobales bacterium]